MADLQIKIKEWTASPTSRAGSGFYPTRKFIGRVLNADGAFVAETGKCSTREAALQRATVIAAQVSA